MEDRYIGALRRIYEADAGLIKTGQEPTTFRLSHPGGLDRKMDHPQWDPSWAVPSAETIDDLGELGILRVEPPFNKARVFSLTISGRKEAMELLAPAAPEHESGLPASRPHVEADLAEVDSSLNPKKVAVMHGRDLEAKGWIFDWLRRVGLEPMEWNELVGLTGKGTPYNGEAVAAAFEIAQAVIVLFTPDEVGFLHPGLVRDEDDGQDSGGQPRLNVVLEAGMAFQSHTNRTVLIEIGHTREISDLAGRNTIRLDGAVAGLNSLASRLEVAGCTVRRTGNDWLDTDALTRLEALKRRLPKTRAMRGNGCAAIRAKGSVYRAFTVSQNRVEERVRDKDGWSEWSEIGSLPKPVIDITVSSLGLRHVELFVLLSSGEVMHKRWNGDYGWKEKFQSLGQPFGLEPVNRIAAATMEEGHQEIFVEAEDGLIGHIWYSKLRWHRNSDPSSRLNDGWWRFT